MRQGFEKQRGPVAPEPAEESGERPAGETPIQRDEGIDRQPVEPHAAAIEESAVYLEQIAAREMKIGPRGVAHLLHGCDSAGRVHLRGPTVAGAELQETEGRRATGRARFVLRANALRHAIHQVHRRAVAAAAKHQRILPRHDLGQRLVRRFFRVGRVNIVGRHDPPKLLDDGRPGMARVHVQQNGERRFVHSTVPSPRAAWPSARTKASVIVRYAMLVARVSSAASHDRLATCPPTRRRIFGQR